MRPILCLTKPGRWLANGKPEPDKIIHLYQTPTELTLCVASYISDRWHVFDAYRAYVETLNGFEGNSLHLDVVRSALLGGFVWSVI